MPVEGRGRKGEVKLPCKFNKAVVNPIRAVPTLYKGPAEIAGLL